MRDPKKPDEPEERGRNTRVTAIQMEKGTLVCKVTEADAANVLTDDSVEITVSLLGAVAEKRVWTNALKKPYEVLGAMPMSQNENVSILARCGKTMPT